VIESSEGIELQIWRHTKTILILPHLASHRW